MDYQVVSGDIPDSTPPAEIFEFKISGVRSSLITFDEEKMAPNRVSKSERLVRYTLVSLRFGTKVKVRRWNLTMDGKHIELFGTPASVLHLPETSLVPAEVEIVTYYGRPSKPKILSAFYFENERPPSTPHRALERFDQVYGVDTNTASFEKFGSLSVTIAMKVLMTQIGNGYGNFHVEPFMQFARRNASNKPEVSGWIEVLQQILADPEHGQKKIGIVVDSELGKIQKINARRIPLQDNFYLPKNFELVFATDATGSEEFFPNKLIRACDRAASLNIEDIARRHALKKTRLVCFVRTLNRARRDQCARKELYRVVDLAMDRMMACECSSGN